LAYSEKTEPNNRLLSYARPAAALATESRDVDQSILHPYQSPHRLQHIQNAHQLRLRMRSQFDPHRLTAMQQGWKELGQGWIH